MLSSGPWQADDDDDDDTITDLYLSEEKTTITTNKGTDLRSVPTVLMYVKK